MRIRPGVRPAAARAVASRAINHSNHKSPRTGYRCTIHRAYSRVRVPNWYRRRPGGGRAGAAPRGRASRRLERRRHTRAATVMCARPRAARERPGTLLGIQVCRPAPWALSSALSTVLLPVWHGWWCAWRCWTAKTPRSGVTTSTSGATPSLVQTTTSPCLSGPDTEGVWASCRQHRH